MRPPSSTRALSAALVAATLAACGVDSSSASPVAGAAGSGEAGGGPSGAGAGGSSGRSGVAGEGGAAGGGGTSNEGGAAGGGGTSNEGGSGGVAGVDQAGTAGSGAGDQGGAGQNGGAAGTTGGAGSGGNDAGQGGSGDPGGSGGNGGPHCGDGLVNQADEECDDGNGADGDACTGACKVPCPPGGKLVAQTGRCYFLSGAKTDAFVPDGPIADPCAGPGEHVAILTHPDDVETVRQGHAFDGAWVGARANDEGTNERFRYRWFEGPSLSDAPWDTAQPLGFAARRCVAFQKDGGDISLGNRPCDEDRFTLCVREPVCAVAGKLGFVHENGHCFVAHAEPATRDAAAQICSGTYGGHLAAFPTQGELSRLGGYGIANHWLDAVQAAGAAEPGGGWSWPSENATALGGKAEQWAGERPDDGGDAVPPPSEGCAMLTRGRRLDDRPCSESRPALCEIP